MKRLVDMPEPEFDSEAESEDSLPLQDLLKTHGRPCAGCSGPCSAFEVVWSIALGFKNSPRCLNCLARGLGRETDELRLQVTDYVHRRECYLRAWREAERIEGRRTDPTANGHAGNRPATVVDASNEPACVWDAGDMACGDLVLALRIRLNALPAGTLLHVRATDPAAPEDIPAWCRLTGHHLESARHPEYAIRRKGA